MIETYFNQETARPTGMGDEVATTVNCGDAAIVPGCESLHLMQLAMVFCR